MTARIFEALNNSSLSAAQLLEKCLTRSTPANSESAAALIYHSDSSFTGAACAVIARHAAEIAKIKRNEKEYLRKFSLMLPLVVALFEKHVENQNFSFGPQPEENNSQQVSNLAKHLITPLLDLITSPVSEYVDSRPYDQQERDDNYYPIFKEYPYNVLNRCYVPCLGLCLKVGAGERNLIDSATWDGVIKKVLLGKKKGLDQALGTIQTNETARAVCLLLDNAYKDVSGGGGGRISSVTVGHIAPFLKAFKATLVAVLK